MAKKSAPKLSLSQKKRWLELLTKSDTLANAGSSNNYRKIPVVVDSSIFISGLLYDGKPEIVARHVLELQQFITSEEIIEEIISYIRTTRPKVPHKWTRELHKRLLEYARDFDRTPKHKKLRDINDVHVVQLAAEHSAIIITGDKDLLEYKDFTETAILSVAEYSELFIN